MTLERQQLGFGFRIVGGTEEGSQVTVGHIVPGGSADGDQHIATGDEILSIDGHNVVSTELMIWLPILFIQPSHAHTHTRPLAQKK